MMLNRTLLLSVIIAAVSALFLFGTSSSVAADEKAFSFHIENAVVLGQSQNDARRGPTLGDHVRRMFDRILRDDSPENNNNNQRPAQIVVPPAVPTQPPKPPTAAEIQQSVTSPSQAPANAGNNSQSRTGSAPMISRDAADDGDGDGELPIHVRLQRMREGVFSNPEVEVAAQRSRQPRTAALTPSPVLRDTGNNPSGIAGDLRDFAEFPAFQRTTAVPTETTGEIPDVFVPFNFEGQQVIPRSDRVMPERFAPNQIDDPFPSAQQPAQRAETVEPEQRREPPSRQVLVSESPQLKIEIDKPPSAVVGQEITYRIHAANVGNVPVEDVVLNVEIPPWIDIRHTDADNGNWVLLPRSDGSGVADLKWRVNRINRGETNLLRLHLVPQLHRAVELPMQYDFYRPAIIAKVEVQEPKLAMELIGPEEVRWNDTVIYTLIVRNIGNGNAEKLRFELLQSSSSERRETTVDYLLPGEGQEMSIEVQAGRDQEQLDIAVLATGAHDLKNEVRRRVRVLRPKLEMSVQTSPLHFVDEPAELFIRVQNNGNADADNVIIRAELPLGAHYVASSEGGLFVQQQQQNIVEWRGRSIEKGQMQTFSLVCIPKREGECRVSVEASESGSVLATRNGTFTAEAIVELDLAILRPSGPIGLGQEVTYTIEVTNIGTKAAEDVEVSIMFSDQLEPHSVTGRDAKHGYGQVFFEKIPMILPKQCVTLMVHVEAKEIGTAQIRAEVVRSDVSGTPIRLEQGLSAHIFCRQRGVGTAEQTTQNEFFR